MDSKDVGASIRRRGLMLVLSSPSGAAVSLPPPAHPASISVSGRAAASATVAFFVNLFMMCGFLFPRCRAVAGRSGRSPEVHGGSANLAPMAQSHEAIGSVATHSWGPPTLQDEWYSALLSKP